MGIRIKDAALVSSVSEGYKIPISDGSNQPKTASVGQIGEFVNQKYGVEQKLSELGSDVKELNCRKFEVGSVNYGTGKEEDNSSRLRTYYIPTKDISYIYGRNFNLVFFDSSLKHVGYLANVCIAEEKDFSDYDYVRIVNAYSSNEEDIVVWYKDNTLLDYELGNTGVRLLKDCMLLSLKTMKFQEQQGFYSAIIPCKSGDKINITGKGGASARLYTVIDEAKNIIAQAESEKLVYKENIETSTDGYVILNFSNVYPYKAFFWRKGIVNISSDILSAVEDLSNSKTVISGVFNSWNPNALGNEGQNVNNSGHHIRVDLSRFSPDYVIQGKLRCIVSVYSLVYDKDGNLLRIIQGNENDFYYRIQDGDAYIVLSNYTPLLPLEDVYLKIERKTDELIIDSLSDWEQDALGIDGLNVNRNGHHIRVDLSKFNSDYVIQGKLRCIAQVYSLVYDKDGNIIRTVQGRNNYFFYRVLDGDAYIVLSNYTPALPLSDVSVTVKKTVVSGSRKLRVLCIGNSYTYDAMTYTPYIMRMLNNDVDIELGIWYHGGQHLGEHWRNIQNKTAVGYQYAYSNGVEPWFVREEVTFDEVLGKGWDVVTLQQASYLSRDYTSYQPYLDNIINYIQENTLNHVKFMWLLTPSYSKNYAVSEGYPDDYTSDKMHEDIVAASKSAYENTIIEGIIPVGTAIQNARHTELASLGDNYGELTNGIHLQSGLPCKIESMTSALCLFRLIGMEYISVAGFKFYATSDWLDSIHAPQEDGAVTGETLENNVIAQRCVIYAVNNKKFF